MNKDMKKTDNEKKPPKFKARTLGADELRQVTGGVARTAAARRASAISTASTMATDLGG